MPPVTGSIFLLQVNTGTDATPVWTTVGAQRDYGEDASTALVDLSNKDQRAEVVAGGRWASDITLTHLYVPGATEQRLLRDANRNGTLVTVRKFENGVATEKATGVVTGYAESQPDMDAATVDVTIHLSNAWTAA